MAIPHARSGEVISLRPLGARLAEARSKTLLKTDSLEMIRLVVPAGKELARHEVPGEVTLPCLERLVELTVRGNKRQFSGGGSVYLEGSTPHAVHAAEDVSLLLTILLPQTPKA